MTSTTITAATVVFTIVGRMHVAGHNNVRDQKTSVIQARVYDVFIEFYTSLYKQK